MADKKYPFAKKIASLNGGTGHFTLLTGLVELNQPELITAMPPRWDSGGSSGTLRVEMGVLPVGDIRQCRLALMLDPKQRKVAQKVMNVRTSEEIPGLFKNHPFGNIMEAYFQHVFGPDTASEALNTFLGIRSQIVPSSNTNLKLCAKTLHGQVYESEGEIDHRYADAGFDPNDRITNIYFDTAAEANPKAIEAIKEADIIISGPGSLHTSVLPHLCIEGIAEAIQASPAKLVLVLNVMTQKGDTDNFKPIDFLGAYLKYLGDADRLNYLIVNEDSLTPVVRSLYESQGQNPIIFDQEQAKLCQKLAPNLKIIRAKLGNYDPKAHLFRHDSLALAKTILSLS